MNNQINQKSKSWKQITTKAKGLFQPIIIIKTTQVTAKEFSASDERIIRYNLQIPIRKPATL